jgi:hypothetical protein
MNGFDRFLTSLKRKTRSWNFFAITKIKRFQYWDKLLSFLFSYPSRCFCRKAPLEIEKFKNPNHNLKYFSDNFGRFSTSKSLIGVVSLESSDVIVTQHLLKIIFETLKSSRILELCTIEILSKVLAYRNLQENMKIWVPIATATDHVEYVEFVVDTIFDLWHQHTAFGLRPVSVSHISPILLFRGTDFSFNRQGGRASILSDLDPDGPGRRLYLCCRSSIRHWLLQMSHLGEKTRVLGHSLGGVLATYAAVYEHDLISKNPLQASYSFNAPGITEDLLADWNDLAEEDRPSFYSFVTRGDIVSKFGKMFGETYETFTSRPLSPMLSHEQLIFSQPLSYMCKIDVDKENDSSSRKYYSTIQKQTTSWAYRFGLRFLFPQSTL